MEEKTAHPSPGNPTIPSPEEVVKDVKKGNFNKSVILVIVLVILTAVLLVISINMRNGSPAPYVTKKVQTNFAKTNLSISEDVRAATTSGAYETDVNIDTGGNKVTGVQLSLSYDPKVLTSVDIKPGTFLPGAAIVKKTIDTQNGTITFSIGTALNTAGVNGSGQIAVISFNKVNPEDTQIDFLPDTLVSAQGSGIMSALNKTSSAVIGPLPAQ